nr:SLC13 family permease [Aequorivita sp. S2608]
MSFALPIQQIIVCGVTLVLIVFLFLERVRPAFLFFTAVLIFLLVGIIDTADLLEALANESILSVFLLIFITTGIKTHFNLIGWLDRLFAKAKNGKNFMLRMTTTVAGASAVLNNTPIVALFLPYVYQWSRKNKVSPSKLLIPLSFAAIAGGMMTVIGTSTNLVLKGLIEAKNETPPGILDYLLPGLFVSIGGILFLYFWGYKHLPNRIDLLKEVERQPREYLVEVRIVTNSSIIGQSVNQADLRNLKGVYLFEIIREGRSISPVSPQEVIQKGDALVFAGDTDNIMELLERKQDFTPPLGIDKNEKLDRLNIIETVIPFNSELVGKSLKDLEFRENYDAAVLAVHRKGERLNGKIGELPLQAGDLLLISPGETFQHQMENRKSLYLVSTHQKRNKAHSLAKKGFVVVLIALIAGISFGVWSLFFALLLLMAFMVATKLLSIGQIKQELDIDLLVILISSLAFSTALIQSGAAQLLADNLMLFFQPLGPAGVIIGVYIITLLLTTFVTHVAAVSIVFPIGYALALQLPDVNSTALFLAIAFAASASFHSPFSYQTNTMVLGPGGYKLKDFIKIGSPFTLIYSILALAFILLYY